MANGMSVQGNYGQAQQTGMQRRFNAEVSEYTQNKTSVVALKAIKRLAIAATIAVIGCGFYGIIIPSIACVSALFLAAIAANAAKRIQQKQRLDF